MPHDLRDTLERGAYYIVKNVGLERETAKARLVTLLCSTGDEPTTMQVWVPKSETTLKNGFLLLPSWLLRAKLDDIEPLQLACAVDKIDSEFNPPVDSDDPNYYSPLSRRSSLSTDPEDTFDSSEATDFDCELEEWDDED